MASVFALLEAFTRKEAAALGFFPCATASFGLWASQVSTARSLLMVYAKRDKKSTTFVEKHSPFI